MHHLHLFLFDACEDDCHVGVALAGTTCPQTCYSCRCAVKRGGDKHDDDDDDDDDDADDDADDAGGGGGDDDDDDIGLMD